MVLLFVININRFKDDPSLITSIVCDLCLSAVEDPFSLVGSLFGKFDEEDYSKRLRSIVTTTDSEESGNTGLSATGQKQVDAIERMLVNLEDIKQYYTWSHKQAQSSFWLAVSACIAGFVFLIVATFAALLFNNGWEYTFIPAISGAITELIAATALLVYKHSLSQLNYYHEALHEDERFLSSINLVDRLSSQEDRDSAVSKIIDSELDMNLEFVRKKEPDNQEK